MTHAEKVRARGRDLLNRVAALNAEEFNELRLIVDCMLIRLTPTT